MKNCLISFYSILLKMLEVAVKFFYNSIWLKMSTHELYFALCLNKKLPFPLKVSLK